MANDINFTFGASLAGGAKGVFSSLASGLGTVAKGLKAAAAAQIALGQTNVAAALNSSAKALTNLTKNLNTATTANKNFNKGNQQTLAQGGMLQTMFTSLGKSIRTYSKYMVSSNLILGVTSSFRSAKDSVVEYDQALHDLKAITLATSAETGVLAEAVIRVASATKFSMGEVGGAMKRLAQAGFSASEVAVMIGPIAELATGSLESLDTTVSLVSTAIRVFNLEVSQTAEVVDIFSNAVNRSRLTVSGLNTTFNYIGPIAAATGLTLKDTSASMMLLANSGIKFSTIGTGLRRIIGVLASPTDDFKDAILAAGYTLADFNPNLSDFRDILVKLPKVVKTSSESINFFGLRGSSAVAAFTTQGIAEYDRLRASVDRVGTTSGMAAEQMKGLQNALKNISDRAGVLSKTIAEGGFLTVFKLVVETIRSLLTVLIALAGNPIGQTLIAMASLATAVTLVTVAFVAFTQLSLGTFLTGWVVSFVALTSAVTGVGAASFTASSGVITLTSAVKGLLVSVVAFIATPWGAALWMVTAAATALFFVMKKGEKNLREAVVQEEKYSSALSKTRGMLDRYKKTVEEHGAESKEAKEQAVKLRDEVIFLGQEYTKIATPLYEFTKRVDQNTGSILGNEAAIRGLQDVLAEEYEKSILAGIAASEKLAGSVNLSAERLKEETARLKENAAFRQLWGDRLQKIGKALGMTFSGDPLNSAGIDQGIESLTLLAQRAEDGSEKAAEALKIHQEGGEELVELLLKEYTTREKLSKMTNDGIRETILLIKNLTLGHQQAAAAAELSLQAIRDTTTEITIAKDKEAKRLAEVAEIYGYFNLDMEGTTKKMEAWVVKFERLLSLEGLSTDGTKDLAVSSEELVNQIKMIGDSAVKTSADYTLYMGAVAKLRDSNKLTKEDLWELEKTTREVFSNIRTQASDLESAFSEKMNSIDLSEQKRTAGELASYIAQMNTEGAITEKTHQKNLEKIQLDSLGAKLHAANLYVKGLKDTYTVDSFQYRQGLIVKYEAYQAYLKAQADYLKPDLSGQEGKGPTFAQKIAEKEFDLAIARQIQAAKTMNAELKAAYETLAIDIHTYYDKQEEYEREATKKHADALEARIIAVRASYDERIELETEANRKAALSAESKEKEIELEILLNKVREEGTQALAKLNGERAKELENMDKKVRKLLEETLQKTEESRMNLPWATEDDKYETDLARLKRFHAEKLEEMKRAGGADIAYRLQKRLQEEEIENIGVTRQKQIFDLKVSMAQQFAADMAGAMQDFASSGMAGSKTFFKAYQAFAVAESIISTYSSAQAAYDKGMKTPGVSAGAAQALAVAGATIAMVAGMAKVAKIQAAKPQGMKDGGLVRGPGGPRDDRVNVDLSNREFVQPADVVSHYGENVMEAMRKKAVPKALFAGLGEFKRSPVSTKLAAGGFPKASAGNSFEIQLNQRFMGDVNEFNRRQIGVDFEDSIRRVLHEVMQ